MISNTNIDLDLKLKSTLQPVFAKKNDTGRTLNVSIYDGGTFSSASGYTTSQISLNIKNKNEVVYTANATTIEDNGSITFALTEDMLGMAGNCSGLVILNDGTNILTTRTFNLYVEDTF